MLSSDASPNLDGSIFRAARATAREIMIPVYLHAIDRPTINTMKRELFRSFNPKKGHCLLKFTEGDGTTRQLAAYYKGGMEGAEGTDTAGFSWTRYGLQFTAMDPWFYSDRPEILRLEFGTGDPLVGVSEPFFPMDISDGVMGGPGEFLEIVNPGDIEAWPVWALQGPIKGFELTSPYSETVRASPPVSGADLVPAGRVLTIDTRPGKKTVKNDLGVNFWGTLDTSPEFWSVEPGITSATVSVVAGSINAAVTLTFYPRYASYV
ncbi:phage tail domain-containing protein [Streptomyces sp. NPDC055036]